MLRALLLSSSLLLGTRSAEAHFLLLEPASWTEEDALGDPQKAEPCGGESGTPTGAVSTFRVGETITLRWQETIYHPGHWRIALAEDRNDLIDPVVTVDGNQVSVSATIQDPPVPPVLIDNLFPRTGPGSAMTFEQEITLPRTPCARCTVQVIQFMVGHGPPNYIYHHCADIEIIGDPGADAGTALDAAVDDASAGFDAGLSVDAGVMDAAAAVDGGGRADSSSSSTDGGFDDRISGGCSCYASDRPGPGWLLGLILGLCALGSVRYGFGFKRSAMIGLEK